jgi:hypothetical protein
LICGGFGESNTPTCRRGVTRSQNEMRELEHSEGGPQVIEDAPHFKLEK